MADFVDLQEPIKLVCHGCSTLCSTTWWLEFSSVLRSVARACAPVDDVDLALRILKGNITICGDQHLHLHQPAGAKRKPSAATPDGRESRPTRPSSTSSCAAAAGSARDALSLLDQALAVGGGTLDCAAVQAALGGAPFDLRMAVLEAVAGEDVAGALVGVNELLTQGHDVRRVADDLLRTLRDAFMAANANGRVPYDGPAEEAIELAALAQAMGNALRGARRSRSSGRRSSTSASRPSPTRGLVLEVAVVRVARREARTSVETLLERVERLERQLAAGGVAPPGSAPAPAPAPVAPPAAAPDRVRAGVGRVTDGTRAGAGRAPRRAREGGGARARTAAGRRAAHDRGRRRRRSRRSRSIPTT